MSSEVASAFKLGETYLCLNCEIITHSTICPSCGQRLWWIFKNLEVDDEVARKIAATLNSKVLAPLNDHKDLGDHKLSSQDLNERWG